MVVAVESQYEGSNVISHKSVSGSRYNFPLMKQLSESHSHMHKSIISVYIHYGVAKWCIG